MQRLEDWPKTLYDMWLQGTFINFREEEIFIFGAWVYAIMRLSTQTDPPFPYAAPCQIEEARVNTTPPSLTNKKGRNVGSNGTDRFQFLFHP
jgi:hypothetical protein